MQQPRQLPTPRLRCIVECRDCQAKVDGWLDFDVTDSGGFMLFGNGPVCDDCLERIVR